MMRLDGAALQNIRINGALREKFDPLLFSRLFFKHADKFGAYDLALLFGFGHAGQFIEKAIDRIDVDEIRIHLISEHFDHLFGLTLAQKAVIDVYADEIFTDRLDEERRNNGRIHPSRQCEEHFFISYLLPDLSDLLVDERLCKPRIRNALHIVRPPVVFHVIILRKNVSFAAIAGQFL